MTYILNILTLLVSKPTPWYKIQSVTEAYEIYGVDAIWHNQYLGSQSDFLGLRRCFYCDIDALLLKVAGHVQQGLYSIISLNATKHSLVVVCGCTKMREDMPDDMFHEHVLKEDETQSSDS